MKIKLVKESLYESFHNDEAEKFQKSMIKLEMELQSISQRKWDHFEGFTDRFWRELKVNNWKEAYNKDPMGCLSFRTHLLEILNNSR